jgi:dipeptidase E
MQNVTKNNRVYLSGGGNENQSFPLDKFFFNTLSKNGLFLYVPVALRGSKLYPTAHLWMKGILELHGRNDLQFENADDLSKYQYDDLKKYDAIYIGGGNTWNLMQELRNSGFSTEIIQYIKNGGSVYGGSAGAIVLGKSIDTHDDENTINLKDASGFNLLNDYSVACHYKDEQNNRFEEWVIQNNLPIICLPEETGLILENNSALCAGTKPCVIYLADGTKKEIQPEESFRI